eukprot:gb/GECG01016097.1/.p1 GENE.gb/GECG01016097.1/~~gb/GECG01016097.1/.p1  ORF type:complete len:103 (+),score=8.66 gb/GECG01016097.1/:1-309(+)
MLLHNAKAEGILRSYSQIYPGRMRSYMFLKLSTRLDIPERIVSARSERRPLTFSKSDPSWAPTAETKSPSASEFSGSSEEEPPERPAVALLKYISDDIACAP